MLAIYFAFLRVALGFEAFVSAWTTGSGCKGSEVRTSAPAIFAIFFAMSTEAIPPGSSMTDPGGFISYGWISSSRAIVV
jgi:hypothetical protein